MFDCFFLRRLAFTDGAEMENDPLLDELRQLERDVVAGEGRLAELEALVANMKRQKVDTGKAEAELQAMRENQRLRQQDRQRILSLLQR